ncbi:hypothetical protein MIR68_009305 [Amoeboaphelidium protococcarum]|nr:hypothetical protein MIR68_009305 [Amoeboaphelidium protococcarum]
MLIPTELLLQIFDRLNSPRQLNECNKVCRVWRQVANDSSLWYKFVSESYISPITPINTLNGRENLKDKERERFSRYQLLPDVNYKQIYLQWWREFSLVAPQYPVIKQAVSDLVNWLRLNSQSTTISLNSGRYDFEHLLDDILYTVDLSLDSLSDVQQYHSQQRLQLTGQQQQQRQIDLKDFGDQSGVAGVENLYCLALLYHFIDGQKARMPHVDNGLFGTFTCYGQFTSLFMLPSKHLSYRVVFGFRLLIFAVCPRSGRYLAMSLNQETFGAVVQVSDHDGSYIMHGYFQQWFLSYVKGLVSGNYALVGPDKSLSLFPQVGPFASTRVTRHIEVNASAVGSLEAGRGVSIYRIRLRNIEQPGEGNGGGNNHSHPVSQLLSRKWIVTYQSGATEMVQGDAVIGLNPIIGPSESVLDFSNAAQAMNGLVVKDFSYCSICQPRHGYDIPVSMEGEFIFQPGTITRPTGETFSVAVGQFAFPQLLMNPYAQRLITAGDTITDDDEPDYADPEVDVIEPFTS